MDAALRLYGAVSVNDWAQLIGEVAESKADKVPEGFQTRAEISKEMNVGDRRTREILTALVGAKKIERRDFSIVVNGALRKVPHYRKL